MTVKNIYIYILRYSLLILLTALMIACGGNENIVETPAPNPPSTTSSLAASSISNISSSSKESSSIKSSLSSSNGNTVEVVATGDGTYIVATGSKVGFSLYTFENDKSGASTCYGKCAETWIPYTIESLSSLKAPAGVNLGVVTRTDSRLQVTLNNEPLYLYINDLAIGDITGNGVGFVWWLASIAGTSSSNASSSATNSSLSISSSLKSSSSSSSATTDSPPDQFNFDDILSASPSTEYVSNTITITGITTSIPISISSGTYSLNSSAFTKANGFAVDGDTIQLKMLSSSVSGGTQRITLTAGALTVNWTATNAGIFEPGYTRDLIDSFGSLDGWSVISGSGVGSQSILPFQGPNGENVIRLSLNEAGTKRGMSKTILPKNFNNGWFGQWIRFPNLSLSNKTVTSFWRDPFSTNGYYQRVWTPNSNTKVDESTVENNDWEFVMWRGEEMAASGKQSDGITPTPPFNTNDVWFNKIYIQSIATGNNSSVDFGPAYANIRQNKPRLLITFDDSNVTDFTKAFAYLKPLGIKATTYTIPNLIDHPGFLSLAQLHELKAAGWTIASHHELNLAKLPIDKLFHELSATKDWMIANGFESWTHMAYPEGAFNPAIVAQMKALGFKSGRTVIARPYPLIPENSLFHLGGVGSSRWKTASEGIADIDTAIASGGTMFMFAHRLEPTIGSLEHTNIDIWKAVVDYAIAKRDAGEIDIITMDELYDIAKVQPGRRD